MKKISLLLSLVFLIVACNSPSKKKERILQTSVGRSNSIITVINSTFWVGPLGDEIRKVFGEHQVGLPQPETLISMSQVDPTGFKGSMRINKAVMVVQKGEKEGIRVEKDRYASPQAIVYVTASSEEKLKTLINTKAKEIISIFKKQDIEFLNQLFETKKLNEKKYNTIKELGISMTIPNTYRLVKDSIGFLWLRQHLRSGITRGDGSNNILVYSLPLKDKKVLIDSISQIRNTIGKTHIPGDNEGMYMITEEAYTPHIFEADINGRKAIETRGKWEVKGDFMAGPFVNYMIIDQDKKRVIVFEGFTYAPSVNKRDFLFELEAIAKSIKF